MQHVFQDQILTQKEKRHFFVSDKIQMGFIDCM